MTGTGAPPARPTWIEVDPAAVAHNVSVLRAHVAPAPLWAVVKADGYGHGAATVARAALDAGAEGLAVALVEEAEELRAAGIDAPVMLLSEPPPGGADRLVAAAVEPTAYSIEVVDAVADAVTAAGRGPWPVHLKVDTGMHRVGATPEVAVRVGRAVADHPDLRLASVWTHLAVADEPASDFTAEQLRRFDAACAELAAAGVEVPLRHAANSAGAIAHPAARLDRVRAGIAVYGIAPSPELAGLVDLRPALRLVSRVSHVKTVAAGGAISYGQRYQVTRDTTVATVPVGYADGVRRSLAAAGAEVLIGGRRLPIAGTVTMDQITVDCGPDAPVARGDEVVLLGRQGDEEVTAEEWAGLLGTIGYEVTCGLGRRVPRVVVADRPGWP
ncbi:alanine racemase [Iamia majanohamensis]|uniref:Alanine racemase n=1 Tax=Iamia majanohamensis TaxID=467976 RepID=A0AAE9Y8V7_9ACTN|nr:alanine racemase [Iamia majanohamensis]WCO66628.1 alanine racemase [Iamia majanohamensis]